VAFGHHCWVYDDPVLLDARAVEFLAAGLAAGEQVWLIADGPAESLAARLDRVPGIADALRRGTARLVPVEGAYRHGEVIDPEGQVRAYARATDEALAAGHTGLRVVAEATDLVRTPAQRRAFLRYEHLIDRFMRHRPMSAICGYDRRELDEQAIAELACLHPETNTDVLFRLHADAPGGATIALAGELDPSVGALLATALEAADPVATDGRLVIDATRLRFIDHRSLLHLREHARRQGARTVLRTSRSSPARLVELLDLADIQVERVR
jgi:anti-anti-sigma regulatory factor